jgi:hypothetical protein
MSGPGGGTRARTSAASAEAPRRQAAVGGAGDVAEDEAAAPRVGQHPLGDRPRPLEPLDEDQRHHRRGKGRRVGARHLEDAAVGVAAIDQGDDFLLRRPT